MQRITQSDLATQTRIINDATKSPLAYSKGNKDGSRSTNIGHYHLDYAYGGVKLVRTMNGCGGIRVISEMGYGTKKELYYWMNAFIAGLDMKDGE